MMHPCQRQINSRREKGFTLLMTLALGLIMTLMGTGLIIRAQRDSAIASARKDTGKNAAIAEGGIARTLAFLKQSNNAALLTRNYDPINPRTGTNYLGADGASNSGDETGIAVDEWTGYNPSTLPCFQTFGVGAPNLPLTGTIGNGTYTLRAYRYNPIQQVGTVLIEGNDIKQSQAIAVTVTLKPFLEDFPSILGLRDIAFPLWPGGAVALRGRQVLGSKGNIYYNPIASSNPTLMGISFPNDPTRPSYLDAIWSSSTQDGAVGDPITGKIVACGLSRNSSIGTPGTNNLGIINTSLTLVGTGGSVPTKYIAQEIHLANSDTLAVDTTNGPVYLYIVPVSPPPNSGLPLITFRNTAKIVNIRTDGKPPKVGDLRILSIYNTPVTLYDQTCIQNAFLWFPGDELRLFTTGAGCPGGRNTNFEGVAWMEAILSSKNNASNRNINYLGGSTGTEYDTLITPGATSGIYVPEDLSSLTDVLQYVDWPVRYQISDIKSWSRQRL